MKNVVVCGLALCLGSFAVQAKAPWLKKAKDGGVEQVKDCKACHADKNTKDSLNEAGKWLVAQKATKKATEVDPLWLKEFFAKKK